MPFEIESEQLLIAERNRIAGELHDRVSQHLFGIVCAVHSMKRDWGGMPDERKLDQMTEIQEAAAAASRELRAAIYNHCSAKKSGASWIGTVESMLGNMAKLNGVRIRFHAPDSERQLTACHQKALYRIISEGVGNAIRHGAGSIVDVRLSLYKGAVKLTIADNGIGFDALSPNNKTDSGFGIHNMRGLAASLGGILEIYSRKGSGTRIEVLLPPTADVNDGSGQKSKSG